ERSAFFVGTEEGLSLRGGSTRCEVGQPAVGNIEHEQAAFRCATGEFVRVGEEHAQPVAAGRQEATAAGWTAATLLRVHLSRFPALHVAREQSPFALPD